MHSGLPISIMFGHYIFVVRQVTTLMDKDGLLSPAKSMVASTKKTIFFPDGSMKCKSKKS